jgi:predicted anti-sigma-YlaC factor YlaD
MSECTNTAVRDLLPEYLAGKLGVESMLVDRHLRECDECSTDLALMQLVRAAYSKVPEVDVSRIVASIPPRSRKSVTVRRYRSTMFQLAAALTFVLVGGFSLVIARSYTGGNGSAVKTVAQVDSDVGLSATSGIAFGITFGGGLEDIDPDDLEALVKAIDALEAAPPAEPPDLVGVADARSGDS